MSGIPISLRDLPLAAEKYERLALIDRAAASGSSGAGGIQQAMAEAQSRIGGLRKDLRKAETDRKTADQAKADAIRAAIIDEEARLKRMREKLALTKASASGVRLLGDRLREFSQASVHLKFREVAARPTKGATIDAMRAKLQEVDAEVTAVSLAPAPREDILRRLSIALDKLAEAGKPAIDTRLRGADPANLESLFRLVPMAGCRIVGDAGMTFIVWAFKEFLFERLADLVPKDGPDTLTDDQRDEKLATLEAKKLEIERAEEALIEQAEADGRIIARRPGASPLAILGVEVIGVR